MPQCRQPYHETQFAEKTDTVRQRFLILPGLRLAKACDMGAIEAGARASDSIVVDGFGVTPYP